MQDCNNSIANALELLQSCTKPSIYSSHPHSANFVINATLFFFNGEQSTPLCSCFNCCCMQFMPIFSLYCVHTKSLSSTESIYPKINGSVQDCSISIAITLEILQSCAKPSRCHKIHVSWNLGSSEIFVLRVFPIAFIFFSYLKSIIANFSVSGVCHSGAM